MVGKDEALCRLEAACSLAELCVSEVKTKLKRWKVADTECDEIIESLLTDGYVNEVRFARAFVNDKSKFSKWGKIKIKQALVLKRIPVNCIEEAFEEYDNDLENDTLKNLLIKKHKTFKANIESRDAFAKLVRFGISRGFGYSAVFDVAKKICNAQFDYNE